MGKILEFPEPPLTDADEILVSREVFQPMLRQLYEAAGLNIPPQIRVEVEVPRLLEALRRQNGSH